MYSGESISSVIQSGCTHRIPHSCILNNQVSPMDVTTLYHLYILNLRTTVQKTKNSFMAHLECERQAFFYYNNIQ